MPMKARWTPLIIVVLLLILQSAIHASFAAPVDIIVNTNGADVAMSLVVNDNLTALPAIALHIDPTNSSSIANPLEKAIQKLDPKATVTNLALSVTTRNSTGKWILSENYTFHINGVSDRMGTTVISNLSFLFFNVTDPVIVAGNELNFVTKAYILSALSSQPPGTTYFINGHKTVDASIPGLTTLSFHLLDFTWISSLPDWTTSMDVLGQTTLWKLNPNGDRYNLTLGPFTPEGVFLKAYEVVYHPQFQVTVRSVAISSGNAIHFDVPSGLELIMPALIVVSIILLVTTLIVDRRLTRQNVKRRKR
jgi:hypothetical protein